MTDGPSVARITIGDAATIIAIGDESFEVPCGVVSLGARHIISDPPLPEELTNAIGEMMDHVDDLKREMPSVLTADDVHLFGTLATAMAAVEVGRVLDDDSFVLDRDAAEDVFRTLATEAARDRRHNPGLPAELVDTVVGGCCVVIGLIRGLQLDAVTVMMSPTA